MTELTSSERLLGISVSVVLSLIILIHTLPLMPALDDNMFKRLSFIFITVIPTYLIILWLMEQIKK